MRTSYKIIMIGGGIVSLIGGGTLIAYAIGYVPKMAWLTATGFFIGGLCISAAAFNDLKRMANGRR